MLHMRYIKLRVNISRFTIEKINSLNNRFQIGKGVHQCYRLHLMSEFICRGYCEEPELDGTNWNEVWEKSHNLRYSDDISLMAESEELNCLLDEKGEESEKSDGLNSTFKRRTWHLIPSVCWK